MVYRAFSMLLPAVAGLLSLTSASPLVRRQTATCEQPYYKHEDKVEGIFMVSFDDGYIIEDHFAFLEATFGTAKFDITELDEGYYASLTADLVTQVRSDCNVSYVEDDVFGTAPEENGETEDGGPPEFVSLNRLVRRGQQKEAPWPLIYLSSASKVIDDPTDESYYYVDDAGKGVDIYIVDSGIAHPYDDFADDDGADRVVDEINVSDSDGWSDDAPNAGHGTGVASAAAGTGQGVAKSATIRNVKAELNGAPDAARLVQAIGKIVQRHDAKKSESGFKGSIINMSFVMRKTKRVEVALKKAHDVGISLVAGAGNTFYNPESFPCTNGNVICVGASDTQYEPWRDDPNKTTRSGSNYGKDVVDIWATGARVPLTNKSGKTYFATGTSFASGYVSGILAIFYGVEGPNLLPGDARARLMAQTSEWVTLPDDGTDWHDSPIDFANTGNRKGDALTPKRPYLDGPELSSENGGEDQCSASVGITVDQVNIDVLPIVVVVLRTETDEEVNRWEGDMEEGQKHSLGGLGPDVKWTLTSHTGPEGAYDMDFSYADDVTFKYLDCVIDGTAGMENGYFEQRRCEFPCRD